MSITIEGEGSKMLKVDNASIYYEVAGSGPPLVFLHAGVADSRQWNNELHGFSNQFTVIRYDQRGFGKSEPTDGEFSHLRDLIALLEHLEVREPIIFIGCSMGGGLAMDYALAQPTDVRALIMVDSAPSGLELDVPVPDKFTLVKEAEKAGDLDLVAEIETQIWFDGSRASDEVNQQMRSLAYQMNRLALSHASMDLGQRLPNSNKLAVDLLKNLDIPILAIIGTNDIPYMHAAVEFMSREISNFQQAEIQDAAHLPNMDQPKAFQKIVLDFIEALPE